MGILFDNCKYRAEWKKENEGYLLANPSDEKALYLQLAFVAMKELYEKKSDPIRQRHKIFSCFEQSAKLGSETGLFFEGICVQSGFGCKRDEQIGDSCMQIAAWRRSSALALNYLGLQQFITDPEYAVKCFRQACEQNYPRGHRNLGLCLLYGKGVKQDYAEAIKCLQRAGVIGNDLLSVVMAKMQSARKKIGAVQLRKPNKVIALTSKNSGAHYSKQQRAFL